MGSFGSNIGLLVKGLRFRTWGTKPQTQKYEILKLNLRARKLKTLNPPGFMSFGFKVQG